MCVVRSRTLNSEGVQVQCTHEFKLALDDDGRSPRPPRSRKRPAFRQVQRRAGFVDVRS